MDQDIVSGSQFTKFFVRQSKSRRTSSYDTREQTKNKPRTNQEQTKNKPTTSNQTITYHAIVFTNLSEIHTGGSATNYTPLTLLLLIPPFERQARVKSYTPSASYASRLLVVQRGYTPPDLSIALESYTPGGYNSLPKGECFNLSR